jgi:hypothetical protein
VVKLFALLTVLTCLPGAAIAEGGGACAVNNRAVQIYVTPSGGLTWNGTPISRRSFLGCLKAAERMRPQPEFHVDGSRDQQDTGSWVNWALTERGFQASVSSAYID